MLIPRSYVESYSRSLNVVSDRGRAELERLLGEVDWSGDVATVREQVVEIMQLCCGGSTDMAARLAAEFYDGLRERFGISDGFQAEVDPCREPEATEGAVRAFAQDLADGKPVEGFVSKCSDRLDRETRLAANRCVERNAKRDPKRPTWARVPTGAETCKYCIMLASRGFVYHSEELASHAHSNCDCRVIPSWDRGKASAEGYDPERYKRQWELMEAYGSVVSGAEASELIAQSDVLARLYSRAETLVSEMDAVVKEARDAAEHVGRAELKKQYDALSAEYQSVQNDLSFLNDTQSRVVRTIVGRFRTLGPEPGKNAADYFDLNGVGPYTRQMVEDALSYVPRDWLDTMGSAGVKVRALPSPGRTRRRGSVPARSYYDKATSTIYIARGKDKLTVVHEMMHAMEHHSPEFLRDSERFFLRRTRGKTPRKLNDITNSNRYHDYETAYDMGESCIRPYAFKIYGDPQSRVFTGFEITSIGVEYLYRDPTIFLKDPDHLAFVLHKLREV